MTVTARGPILRASGRCIEVGACPSAAHCLQPFGQGLGRSPDHRAVALPGNRAFQQNGVLGELLQPFLARARVAGVQVQLLGEVFFEADEVLGFALQGATQAVKRGEIEWCLQLLDDLRLDAVFAQQGQGFPALAATWVVQQFERVHVVQPRRSRCWRRPPSWVLKSLRR